MKSAIFGFVAGIVLAIAGASIINEPVKTVALLIVLSITFEFCRGKS